MTRVLIHDGTLSVPYERSCDIGSNDEPFKLVVNGVISSSPQQFAIDISDNEGNILFHFNPRWTEKRTVLNACSLAGGGWGPEESTLYNSLRPRAAFTIQIYSTLAGFQVDVNDEPQVHFNKRLEPVGTGRVVHVRKVESGDISLSSVKLRLI